MEDNNNNNDKNQSFRKWIKSRLLSDECAETVEAQTLLSLLPVMVFKDLDKVDHNHPHDMLVHAVTAKLHQKHDAVDLGKVSILASRVVTIFKDFKVVQSFQKSDFFRNTRLPKDLLLGQGLSDYVQAAEDSFENAKPFLDRLLEIQEPKDDTDLPEQIERLDDNKHVEPNQYVCIIASSGTGKTQLAATASLKYSAATTIYLNLCWAGESNHQRFYRPHVSTPESQLFRTLIGTFAENVGATNEGEPSAYTIHGWAKDHDDGTSLFVRVLNGLLLGVDALQGDKVYLSGLKQKIQQQNMRFLVFLDEVPDSSSVHFSKALCLRNALRYLGIAPILMSTQPGAQAYVEKTSRVSLDVWTTVLTRLPPYAPMPIGASMKPYSVQSERPLVLGKASQLEKNATNLSMRMIIESVRDNLQKSKSTAWTSNPSLQLVQLFCTEIEIHDGTLFMSHNLVGHHFGCVQHQVTSDDQSEIGVPFGCSEAAAFTKITSVAPVSPKLEPLLYLALVTWDESMLLGTKKNRFFPLVNYQGQALTVREVFETHKADFKPKINSENLFAEKQDGNLLEVLVHASFTLASMKTTSKDSSIYLDGMALQEFAPLVRRLMLGGQLDALPTVPEIFKTRIQGFDWPRVPALGGSNSGLPSKVIGNDARIGFLKRPSDNEMVDGFIIEETKGTLFSLECKNYKSGVGATILKAVFNRIPSGVKCSFVFVSSISKGTFQKTSFDVLKKSFSNHLNKGISVVRWEVDKDPYFWKLKNGQEFESKSRTELLVLIIEVGIVGDGDLAFVKKRNLPPCSNFPLELKRQKSDKA